MDGEGAPVGVGVPDGHARSVDPARFAEAAGPERAEVEGDPVLPSDGVADVGRCARHCRAGHESGVADRAGVSPGPASWSRQLDHPGLIRVQEGPGPGWAERPADHVAEFVDAHGDAGRITRKGAQVFDLVGGGVYLECWMYSVRKGGYRKPADCCQNKTNERGP